MVAKLDWSVDILRCALAAHPAIEAEGNEAVDSVQAVKATTAAAAIVDKRISFASFPIQ